MCGGDEDTGGLTGAQRATLGRQKRDVKRRKNETNDYFANAKQAANQEFQLNQQSSIDNFLVESYTIDKKADSDITKGKGLTNFETEFENVRLKEKSATDFTTGRELDQLAFDQGTIERNKAKFDQLSGLEDQLYQIQTELDGD